MSDTSNTQNCLFCRIARREVAAQIVYEDSEIVAFEDIAPQAPKHVLIIPRTHIPSVREISAADEVVIGRIFSAARTLAGEADYRVVTNCGSQAGQTVGHLHFHLLSGRSFGWPPG